MSEYTRRVCVSSVSKQIIATLCSQRVAVVALHQKRLAADDITRCLPGAGIPRKLVIHMPC